jgi:hypothetical protein
MSAALGALARASSAQAVMPLQSQDVLLLAASHAFQHRNEKKTFRVVCVLSKQKIPELATVKIH